MSPTVYYVLHVSSILLLTGYTFYAFAAAPETRKRVLRNTGIASLVAVISGFGLLSKLHYGFPGWVIVKLLCWLGISSLAGVAYRKRAKAGVFTWVLIILALIAVVMVYVKPF